MPVITPRVNAILKFSEVTVTKVEPWSEDEIQVAAQRVASATRRNYMPVVTDKLYRGNAGKSALDVHVVDMSWDEAIAIVSDNPRRYVRFDSLEFKAFDEDGNETVPGLQTVNKRFQREGFLRGIIVGTSITDDDETDSHFIDVTRRANVKRVPKWAQALVEAGERFGSLVASDEESEEE